MANSASTSKQTKRTRQESKLATRRRLLEVGREHILRSGFRNMSAEKIAEEAGFSRGAFYGNFEDLDDLFIAIMLQDHDLQYSIFEAILDKPADPAVLLKHIRDAIVDRVTNSEWIFLHAEFEAGAIHSQKMKDVYVQFHSRILGQGKDVLDRLAKATHIQMSLPPRDFVQTMISLTQGLAINQRLLVGGLSKTSTRKLVRTVFDQLIWIES